MAQQRHHPTIRAPEVQIGLLPPHPPSAPRSWSHNKPMDGYVFAQGRNNSLPLPVLCVSTLSLHPGINHSSCSITPGSQPGRGIRKRRREPQNGNGFKAAAKLTPMPAQSVQSPAQPGQCTASQHRGKQASGAQLSASPTRDGGEAEAAGTQAEGPLYPQQTSSFTLLLMAWDTAALADSKLLMAGLGVCPSQTRTGIPYSVPEHSWPKILSQPNHCRDSIPLV